MSLYLEIFFGSFRSYRSRKHQGGVDRGRPSGHTVVARFGRDSCSMERVVRTSKVFPAKPFEFRPRVHVQFRLVFADAYPYAHRMARRHSVVSLERDGWSILPGRFGGAAHHVLRVRCVSRACRPCFVSGSLRDLEHDIFRQVGKTGPSARQANNEKPCSASAHRAYLHVYLGLQGMGR